MTKEIVVDPKKEMKTNKKDEQAEMQQKVILYRILQSHLEQIRREGEMIERRYIEVEATKQLLDDLKNSKEGTEMILPVGSGIFVKAKLTDDKMLLEIGAGVLSKKGIADAEEFVNKTRAEIEQNVGKLNKEIQETIHKLNDIASELQIQQHHH